LIEAEEFAAEGGRIGGPIGFAGVEREGGAGSSKLGIEIVEIVEDEGLADHGELGGAEFVLAVMADKEMLDDGFEFWRETFDGVHGFINGFKFHDDVAEELSFDGVADGAVVAELVEFADVVEDGGGKQEIEVELGIMRGGELGEAAKTEDVLEEAAKIRVVHDFGGRRALVFRGDGGVRKDGGNKLFQPGIGNGGREFLKLRVKLGDISLGGGEKIGEIDFLGLGQANL